MKARSRNLGRVMLVDELESAPCGTPLPNPPPQGGREPCRRCVPDAEARKPLNRARPADHALAAAWAKVTSISVPVRPPVLIWNLARLASTSALVSDRLTPPEPA